LLLVILIFIYVSLENTKNEIYKLENEIVRWKELNDLGLKTKLDIEAKYNKLLQERDKYHIKGGPMDTKNRILTENNEFLEGENKRLRKKLDELGKLLLKYRNELAEYKKKENIEKDKAEKTN